MKFRQFIQEKRFTVYPNVAGIPDAVEIWENPSKSQIKGLTRRMNDKSSRFIIDKSGDFYLCDATYLTHPTMAYHVGIIPKEISFHWPYIAGFCFYSRGEYYVHYLSEKDHPEAPWNSSPAKKTLDMIISTAEQENVFTNKDKRNKFDLDKAL